MSALKGQPLHRQACSEPGPSPRVMQQASLASLTRRSRRHVLRANTPAVEARRLEPMTKEELVNYLSSGCRPKDQWR